MTQTPLLTITGLTKRFDLPRARPDGTKRFDAVRNVNLTIDDRETVAVVGESGCGKTTLGRCVVRLYKPDEGNMRYRMDSDGTGKGAGTTVNLEDMEGTALRDVRREVRMIFQDPFSSLNPRMTIYDIMADGMRNAGGYTKAQMKERIADLLVRVGLRADFMHRYPHAFSGGQRQRIVIARALTLDPKIIIADEAVSALDVSVRAQVIELMLELQEQMNIAYMFISHDLSVVEFVADRVVVMYLGEIVEVGTTGEIFSNPCHPYTEALMAAIPNPDPTMRRARAILPGDVPDPRNPPTGCRFHPRCAYAQDICRTTPPETKQISASQSSACHFADTLDLTGIPKVIAKATT